jgi:hypothetical protein
MADAAVRNLSPTLGCNAVKELADWKDPKVVPVLISMLEEDAYGGMWGDDLFIPALKAQAALHDITNHWFPFDVVASRAAWEEARKAPDDAGRQAVLERLIPFRGDPLAAEIIGTPIDASIRVKNVSKRTVAIAEQPMDVELRSQLGSFGAAGFDPEKKEDFVVLAPGESVTFPVKLAEDFIRWEPATREVALQYRKLGREFGLPGWIGVVKARFGAEWKEPPRNIVPVEEKWPNGNLKAKGQTLNGERWGLWEFFNEEGDRIRTVDYTKGVTAEANPEHPSNKGKGKPAAQ